MGFQEIPESVAASSNVKVSLYDTPGAAGTHTFEATCVTYDLLAQASGASGGRDQGLATRSGGGGGAGETLDKRGVPKPVSGTAAYSLGAAGAAKTTNGIGNNGGDAVFGDFTAQGGRAGEISSGTGKGGAGGGRLGGVGGNQGSGAGGDAGAEGRYSSGGAGGGGRATALSNAGGNGGGSEENAGGAGGAAHASAASGGGGGSSAFGKGTAGGSHTVAVTAPNPGWGAGGGGGCGNGGGSAGANSGAGQEGFIRVVEHLQE